MLTRLLRTTGILLLAAPLALGQGPDPASPADLSLKGDPAQDMDLGATRPILMPARTHSDGPIEFAPYVCMTSVTRGAQVVPEGEPGRPRKLLGQPAASVLPWLNHLTKEKPAIIFTPRWTLVALLEDARVPDVTSEEGIRLQAWFPELPARPERLTGLQRAHLWALRLLHLEKALGDLLGLGDDGRLPPQGGGYRPLPHQTVELYVFSSEEAWTGFRRHMFKPDADPLSGEILGTGPVAAVHLDAGSPTDRKRRFLHAACLQLLTSHRRLEGGLPPWLRIGLAHYFERRLQEASFRGKDEAGTLPEGMKSPRDWEQVVRDLVASGKSAELGALTATPERGLTLESRLQAWSLVRFLLGVDPARFGSFLRTLYHTPPGTNPQEGLRMALQESYGHDPGTVEKAWKAWVGKHGR